jgi:hypothetical protein
MLAGIREIVTISSPESIGNVYAYSTAAINSVSLCPIRLSSFMSEPITEAETTFRKVFKGPDREAVRRSEDTANRVLSIVKALLNHALRDPPMAFRTIMRGGWSSPSAGSRCREQCIFRSSKRACSLKPRPTKISPIS